MYAINFDLPFAEIALSQFEEKIRWKNGSFISGKKKKRVEDRTNEKQRMIANNIAAMTSMNSLWLILRK